jgi:hypothetical protein
VSTCALHRLADLRGYAEVFRPRRGCRVGIGGIFRWIGDVGQVCYKLLNIESPALSGRAAEIARNHVELR